MPRKPLHVVLQWHITERCNLRCAHCYQEDYSGEELDFEDLIAVYEQFMELLDRLSEDSGPYVQGHINVTGGEPFVRRDFLDVLEVFRNNRARVSYGILTNGTFIDEKMVQRLRELGVSSVQVSMEGARETNDRIRGAGIFERTISVLKHLIRARVPSTVSFTAHRGNFREFGEIASIGRELGVRRVWADRLIPYGSGSDLEEQVLTPDETREFFEIMYRARGEAMRRFCRTEIAMHRALQFLVGGGTPYHCGAGDRLVTVQPNGDLYPCRRMPVRVGNLMETPLAELYEKSKLFQALRDRDRVSDGCEECSFARLCNGGLRCLSYALTGDPFRADPGCWLASVNRNVKGSRVA